MWIDVTDVDRLVDKRFGVDRLVDKWVLCG